MCSAKIIIINNYNAPTPPVGEEIHLMPHYLGGTKMNVTCTNLGHGNITNILLITVQVLCHYLQ